MKRNKFIASLIALAAAPLTSYPKYKRQCGRTGKGFKINAGEGRIRWHLQSKGVNSNVLDVKISGSDTGGNLAKFEQTSLSLRRGTPLHIHPLQNETFYVPEGKHYFQVGKENDYLNIGDSIFLPKRFPIYEPG